MTGRCMPMPHIFCNFRIRWKTDRDHAGPRDTPARQSGSAT